MIVPKRLKPQDLKTETTVKGRPKSRYLRALILLTFLSLQVQAEDGSADPANHPRTAGQQQAMDQVQEELTNAERRWYGLMRVRWHDTQLLSAGLGAMFVKQPQQADCSVGCSLRGWHFEVEPGIYGVQAGLGWGKLVGETGRNGRLLHTVHFGWSVRGVVLRSWGNSSLYPQSQTLVGVEAGLSIIRLNFSMGLLRSLYSGPGEEYGHDWILTTGVGWGF